LAKWFGKARAGQREGGETGFAAEVARLNASRVAGESGRLRDLFDYLVARGPDAPSASQADIAHAVFGQAATEGDDATVRVYVHRLRKRLEDFYATDAQGRADQRLSIPAGAYALRSAAQVVDGAPEPGRRAYRWMAPIALGCTLALVAAFVLGRVLAGPTAPPANALWQPFIDSDRPIMVVVGDYYMFGEINGFHPDQSRLIRDFRIDSPTDLARAQEEEPDRYEAAEDVGLTYLPLSSAYALRAIMPVLTQNGHRVGLMAASELTAATARDYNIVYVGLVSGMGLLEDVTFSGSTIKVGETYDEFTDGKTGKRYASEEARRVASPVYYRDYGYFARFREPGGALVAVIAGNRDTGLRGLAPMLAGGHLPAQVSRLAQGSGGLEGLYQITGQQGADLSEKLLAVHPRR
jgi:hypothetical protein